MLERFPDLEEALEVFSAGAPCPRAPPAPRASPAATSPTRSAPAVPRLHEGLARRTFEAAFDAGVFVGQIRTRLAIPGMEAEGPHAVAQALLEVLDS